MTTKVYAIYEHGKLTLPEPLSLPEKTHVRVTIESDAEKKPRDRGYYRDYFSNLNLLAPSRK